MAGVRMASIEPHGIPAWRNLHPTGQRDGDALVEEIAD
jgi:hypothetical protein